jgi:hypothetical protein
MLSFWWEGVNLAGTEFKTFKSFNTFGTIETVGTNGTLRNVNSLRCPSQLYYS